MYDILGFGNAIVDISFSGVTNDFYRENRIKRDASVLINKEEARRLISKLSSRKEISKNRVSSGGSTANTLSLLGAGGFNAAFFGKVGNDEFGNIFQTEIKNNKCDFVGIVSDNSEVVTATSVVMLDDEGGRTMMTNLGSAGIFEEHEISSQIIHSAKMFYFEGYLFSLESTRNTIQKAIEIAHENNKKICFSLSDIFCIKNNPQLFINIASEYCDVVFCNEIEAQEFFQTTDSVQVKAQNFVNYANKNLTLVITLGGDGCNVYSKKQQMIHCSSKKEKAIDTTGAGDSFAAGFLYGYMKDWSLEKCGMLGNKFGASEAMMKGARIFKTPIEELIKSVEVL